MTRFKPDHEIVLAGFGFADDGPHLVLNDIDESKRYLFPVLGRTFSLKRLPKRYCTGPFDLKTFEARCCPNKVELLPDMKETQCPACIEETGFNPSFYFATTISPQQRAYNLTPHFVYMAYFSPQHLKVGISSETRGIERLLEQGARVAGILKRFANADEARALEAHLCAQEGIYETMRLGTKVRLLSDPFKADAAIETVYEAARAHGVEPGGGVLDLTKYYFGDVEAAPDIVQLPDDSPSDMVAGRCVGMVGGILMLEQGGNVFAAPVKEWESYEVEITVGELLCEYEYEPQQMGLF